MDFVSVKFCYGGEFKHLSDGLVYVGGQQHSFAVDPDELCWWYLKELVVKCDDKIDVESIYYLTPNCGLLDGLRKVYHDNEVMEMAEIAKKFRSVDLFVVCVGGSTPNSTQNDLAQDISKPNRPPKLTPKRAPKVTPQTPTRKSPRDKALMKESNAPVQYVVPPKSPHVITNPNHTSKSSQQHSKLPKPTVDPQISPQNILPETTSEPQPEEDPPECVTQEKLHKNTAAEVFKSRPHWPAKEMIEAVRVGYKANITNFFAYKVKMLAHRKLHGSMKEHYNKVGRYLEALKKASPGTIIELVHTIENNTAVFQRLFLCFEGLIKGWKEGCRRVICIDGCFLKTFLGGQLMAAVGRDGNDQMYPIAWAVVEGENKLSWEWFLTHLQRSLDLGDGKDLVIVSDENPAILSQVAAVLPKAEHRHCARHIFVLWHKAFKGEDMKNKFWNIAMSYNEADYNDAFAALEEENTAAAVAFKSYEPKVFCRAFCSTSSKADVITSNMVETFNNWIINSRTKHLIYMLEEIRASLMQRIVTKREEANKWNGDICPRIQVKLEKEKDEAAKCEVIPSSYTIFQVNHHLDSLSVDLDKKGCTCKKWDSTGIPCCHAVAAIFFCHKQPEDYISPYYTKEVYLKAYSTSIPPIEGERHWPTTNLKLDPPHVKIGPGRPRKNRMKSPHENPKKPGKLTKHGMEMTCTICKVKGHNKRRCPDKDTATKVVDEPQPKRHRGRPRSVSLQVEHTQHTPTSTHHESIAEPSRVGRNGRIMLSRGRCSGRGTPVGRGNGGSGNGETPVGGRGRGNTGRGRGNTGRGKGNEGTNYMNQGSSSNAPTTRSKSKK